MPCTATPQALTLASRTPLISTHAFPHAAAAHGLGSDAGAGAPNVLIGRIFNLDTPQQRRMRDLDPSDIDTLISVKGIVIRAAPLVPDLRRCVTTVAACGSVSARRESRAGCG